MATRPRKPRKWLRPAAIEREYTKYAREASDAYRAAIEASVMPLIAMRQDAIDDIPESAGWFEVLRQGFFAAAARVRAVPLATRVAEFSRRVSRFNKEQFHTVMRSAYGVDVFIDEPGLGDVLKQWESENIRLIKSIPEQALESMHGKIVAAVRRGAPVRDIKAEIVDSYGVTRKRADLIANDQIGKLNGQLTRVRQEKIGVKSYKWRGSLDERERDSHVAREGVVFQWDQPPEDGHPGEPIRCRCSAEPVLPLMADIQGLQYPNFGDQARGASLTNLGNR